MGEDVLSTLAFMKTEPGAKHLISQISGSGKKDNGRTKKNKRRWVKMEELGEAYSMGKCRRRKKYFRKDLKVRKSTKLLEEEKTCRVCKRFFPSFRWPSDKSDHEKLCKGVEPECFLCGQK